MPPLVIDVGYTRQVDLLAVDTLGLPLGGRPVRLLSSDPAVFAPSVASGMTDPVTGMFRATLNGLTVGTAQLFVECEGITNQMDVQVAALVVTSVTLFPSSFILSIGGGTAPDAIVPAPTAQVIQLGVGPLAPDSIDVSPPSQTISV